MNEMKNSLLLFIIALATGAGHAATFTVNNSNPSPGQYTTINAAIAAAAAGDTILVTGTPIDYGSFTVDKNNLTFIGAGHNPDKDLSYSSYVQNISFVANLNGCKVQGFNLSFLGGAPNADNITVEFCLIRAALNCVQFCNDWVIKNCVFACNITCCVIEGNGQPGRSNIVITNNIFDNGSQLCNLANGNNGIVISNNIFLRGTGSDAGAFINLDNAEISNNIFYQAKPTGVSNCVFSNNLSFGATSNELPPVACTTCTGTGNFVNQDPLFTTYTSGQNFQYAHNFILQAGSPGHNAGTDGTDLGVYGLNNVFSETGEPPIPVVRTLTIANPNTAQGAVLNVTVTISNPDPDQ